MTSIIHPLFEECKNYTLDPFWKDKLSNFARNRFPHGVRYDPTGRNIIVKIDGKKTEVIGLPEDDPIVCFQTVMNLLRVKFDMHSNRDIMSRKEEMSAASRETICSLDCEWKKIKPRHLKDQLMMDYIASLKEKYSLTPVEVRHLISRVQLGFQFKSLSQDDVEFSDGIVKDIKGLKFDKNKRRFVIPDYPACSKISEKTCHADKFYSSLKKYLRDDAARVNKFDLKV
jgi:hypothetical protein